MSPPQAVFSPSSSSTSSSSSSRAQSPPGFISSQHIRSHDLPCPEPLAVKDAEELDREERSREEQGGDNDRNYDKTQDRKHYNNEQHGDVELGICVDLDSDSTVATASLHRKPSNKNTHITFAAPPSIEAMKKSALGSEKSLLRRNPAHSLVTGMTNFTIDVSMHWVRHLFSNFVSGGDPTAHFRHLLSIATNYAQYEAAARALDAQKGLDAWKKNSISPYYDWALLGDRLAQLSRARETADADPNMLSDLVFLLRTSLSRSIGDMGRPELYAYTHIGTKTLIEDYIEEVAKTLQVICDSPEHPGWTLQDKYDLFTSIRQSFGRTALLLSGGATLGLNHTGVIKALFETGLLPRIISGTSSGSIIASLVCTSTDEEIPDLLRPGGMHLDFFALESPLQHLSRFFRKGVLYDAEALASCMRRNLGEITFQEAFNRTRRILNITVSSGSGFEMPRLLNYLTAPNVLIWSAVAASCAVPLVFSSTHIYAKDRSGRQELWNPSGALWIDGSVENDLPMNKLSELFNVNHFVVCQVNPHIIPFMQRSITPSRIGRVISLGFNLARAEILHRLNQIQELNILPTLTARVQAIISQRYYGDITIVPDVSPSDFIFLLTNPTHEMMLEGCWRGERATWPKIPIIRNHLHIELTIDRLLLKLRHLRWEKECSPQIAVSVKSPVIQSIPVAFVPTPVLKPSRDDDDTNNFEDTSDDDKYNDYDEKVDGANKRPIHARSGLSPLTTFSKTSMAMTAHEEHERPRNSRRGASQLSMTRLPDVDAEFNSSKSYELESKQENREEPQTTLDSQSHESKSKDRVRASSLRRNHRNSRSTPDVRAWESWETE